MAFQESTRNDQYLYSDVCDLFHHACDLLYKNPTIHQLIGSSSHFARKTMAPDTLSLEGKTALITGSGRENGVGAAIARGFARNGAAVAIHYVSEGSKPRAEKLAENIAKEFGTKTTVVHGSVSDYEATREMVLQTLKGLGVDHIDILGKPWLKPLLPGCASHQLLFSLSILPSEPRSERY